MTITNYYRQFNTSEINIDDTQPFNKENIKYALIFVVLLGVMHFWSKNLMQFKDINPFGILLFRGIISFIISFIFLKIDGVSLTEIHPSKIGIVILGAIIGFLSLCGLYISLYTLSITDAFTLDFLSVLLVTFIDYIIFKGTLRFSHILGYICALAGIIFLVRPSYLFTAGDDINEKSNFLYGFVAGLVSAFLSGVYCGILRKTFVKVNIMASFAYRQLATALLSPIAMLCFNKIVQKDYNYTTGVWLSLVSIAILGWLSNFCLFQVLKEEKLVARVYPFKFIMVILGILVDLLYFKSKLIISTYIGISLIGVNSIIAWYQLFYATS